MRVPARVACACSVCVCVLHVRVHVWDIWVWLLDALDVVINYSNFLLIILP